jgi:hypothetical protein
VPLAEVSGREKRSTPIAADCHLVVVQSSSVTLLDLQRPRDSSLVCSVQAASGSAPELVALTVYLQRPYEDETCHPFQREAAAVVPIVQEGQPWPAWTIFELSVVG